MTSEVEAGIDIETTGTDLPDHKTIEVYIGLWQDGKLIEELNERINPMRSIQLEAQRVHGITSADLVGKPTFDVVAPKIKAILEKADRYIWHNGDSFDGPFLNFEAKAHGVILPVRPSIDTMVHGGWATFDGKSPKLQELAFACGIDYDPALAHAAAYDVKIMMDCYFLAKSWGYFQLPEQQNAA